MNIPKNLKYSKSHEWVLEKDGEYVIGITDHAQSELGDIVFINLPLVDSEIGLPAVAARVGLSPQRLRALARGQLGMPLARWRAWCGNGGWHAADGRVPAPKRSLRAACGRRPRCRPADQASCLHRLNVLCSQVMKNETGQQHHVE